MVKSKARMWWLLLFGAVGDDHPGCTVIGSNNTIGYHAVIGVKCQDMKYKIGNNNILANNTLLAGHVEVEDYVHTAGVTVVHQFSHLGSFSFLGGGSVVSQDVPKYMMAAGERAELRGLNLVGLTRCGFSVAEIRSMRAAYRKIFMCVDANAVSLEERLAEVEQHEELVHVPAMRAMLQSIRNSFAENRRGICKFRHWNAS
ncbi:putative acyl-[acyl-carrier-protein]--UDP-N-acetylglucosamine O-acyltransferase, mitochondrial isoform B [Glycine soja]|uniref:Putative acyl-[acyl-carrier-protein]--UDP-N-acetylglucosamine O-acyltransferase, mitochondrial isoform B n=1 Tax=Glycine soja TaxID=3848 RepID=A0A445LWZ2_GLYSO|nr:putative acyl-[acyl-carrier-protein]--UDP-N-acetylglucosamine O-acyltransferase, mitochondrial isoform B [Glycine soja]